MTSIPRTSKYEQLHGETIADAEVLVDDGRNEMLVLTMAGGRRFVVAAFEHPDDVQAGAQLSVSEVG